MLFTSYKEFFTSVANSANTEHHDNCDISTVMVLTNHSSPEDAREDTVIRCGSSSLFIVSEMDKQL